MNIGERGQVTIPKVLRERFRLTPHTEVEFVVERGYLVLRRKADHPKKVDFSKWIGSLEGDPKDVDEFIEEIRGR